MMPFYHANLWRLAGEHASIPSPPQELFYVTTKPLSGSHCGSIDSLSYIVVCSKSFKFENCPSMLRGPGVCNHHFADSDPFAAAVLLTMLIVPCKLHNAALS
eukprot:4792206-Amphidinium_carterae.1